MFVLVYMALISARNIDVKKIIKFIFIFNLCFIAMHLTLSLLSLHYTGMLDILPYGTYGGTIRYNFLMRHPNYTAAIFFWTLAMYIYLNKNKKLWVNLLLLLIVGSFSYFSTLSRTTLILFGLLGMLLILYKMKKTKFLYSVIKYGFPISAIAFYILVICFSNHPSTALMERLNDILSFRLVFSAIAVHQYGITFLGRVIDKELHVSLFGYSIDTLTVDPFSISCLVTYGAIYLIFITYLLWKYAKKNKNNYYAFIFLTLLIIASISERYMIYTSLAFPIFFMKDTFYEENKKK